MPGWMIDNRNTKLASILQEQLQGSPELSLLLKNLSLSGFSALYDQLKNCNGPHRVSWRPQLLRE